MKMNSIDEIVVMRVNVLINDFDVVRSSVVFRIRIVMMRF